MGNQTLTNTSFRKCALLQVNIKKKVFGLNSTKYNKVSAQNYAVSVKSMQKILGKEKMSGLAFPLFLGVVGIMFQRKGLV